MLAFHWVGAPGDARTVTVDELHAEAEALDALIGPGPVAAWLPRIPELVAVLLARPDARLLDEPEPATTIVTADATFERDELIPMHERITDAERVIVVGRAGCVPLSAAMDAYFSVVLVPGRDVLYRPPRGSIQPVPDLPVANDVREAISSAEPFLLRE